MKLAALSNTAAQISDRQAEAARLKEACRGFESLFIRVLLKEMRSTVTKSTIFGDRREERYFTEMLDDSLAESMAESGGIGLADVLYDQLARQRIEVNNG